MSVNSDGVKKQAELRRKIEYQVACEERAYRIVERLIDNPVSQEHLIDCLHYITTSHYSDIVEERAVSKLCGYPLCPNSLGSVPKQKYMISTKTNTVYDIEARKNFCGPKCYKASKHLEVQISDDPLWTRKNMPPRKYDLLPLDMPSGKMGDEVIVSWAKEVESELDRLEKQEKYFMKLAEKYHEQVDNAHGDTLGNMIARKSVKKGLEEKGSNLQRGETVQNESCVYTLEKTLEELDIKEIQPSDQKVVTKDVTRTDNRSDVRKNNGFLISESKKVNSEDGNTSVLTGKTIETKKAAVKKQTEDSNSNLKAKTDYLMQLLDKKKNLLAKMVDIQNEPVKNSEKGQKKEANTDSKVDDTGAGSHGKAVVNLTGSNEISVEEPLPIQMDTKVVEVVGTEPIKDATITEVSDKVESMSSDAVGTRKSSKESEAFVSHLEKVRIIEDNKNREVFSDNKIVVRETDLPKGDKTYCRVVKEKEDMKEKQRLTGKTMNTQNVRETKPVSTVELICRQVQSWITRKTVDYLKAVDGDVGGTKMTEFEKKWSELVARVDADEKNFDAMLGEEQFDEESKDRPTAPLPHYDVLKQETQDNMLRVHEFMKGSFTYKVKEKVTNEKPEEGPRVVLPTVDRYDQMMIRQKIVLDRINKVLPDLLSPLHLLVQDVFKELRELICTFNLTSENILFRPAEWTFVTLVILRLLSQKVLKIERSFKSPGADKYFIMLLSGLGTSMDMLDVTVSEMVKG